MRLTADAADLLACPVCRSDLERIPAGYRCATCPLDYPDSDGTPDLRLRAPLDVHLQLTLGAPTRSAAPLPPLVARTDPELDLSGVVLPPHLPATLASYLPRAARPGAVALDLGCGGIGSGTARAVLEHAGYAYLGLDHEAGPVLGDAHALPLPDASVDLVVTLAALEHLQFPVRAMSEARRVLRPGGTIVGTVAALWPFHGDSYYHHTHLGTLSSLEAAGLEVEVVAPDAHWTLLRSHADRSLFPRLPGPLARALVAPLELLHLAYWRLGAWRTGRPNRDARLRLTSTSYAFVAHRPR